MSDHDLGEIPPSMALLALTRRLSALPILTPTGWGEQPSTHSSRVGRRLSWRRWCSKRRGNWFRGCNQPLIPPDRLNFTAVSGLSLWMLSLTMHWITRMNFWASLISEMDSLTCSSGLLWFPRSFDSSRFSTVLLLLCQFGWPSWSANLWVSCWPIKKYAFFHLVLFWYWMVTFLGLSCSDPSYKSRSGQWGKVVTNYILSTPSARCCAWPRCSDSGCTLRRTTGHTLTIAYILVLDYYLSQAIAIVVTVYKAIPEVVKLARTGIHCMSWWQLALMDIDLRTASCTKCWIGYFANPKTRKWGKLSLITSPVTTEKSMWSEFFFEQDRGFLQRLLLILLPGFLGPRNWRVSSHNPEPALAKEIVKFCLTYSHHNVLWSSLLSEPC